MTAIFSTAHNCVSANHSLLEKSAFERFHQGDNKYCYRRFYQLTELQLLWKYRFKRHGASDQDQISLAYSETNNVISVCIMACDFYFEFDADSPQGVNLMWGFGLEPTRYTLTTRQEAS